MRLERIPWDGSGVPSEVELRRLLEAEGFGVFCWRDGPGATYSPHSKNGISRLPF